MRRLYQRIIPDEGVAITTGLEDLAREHPVQIVSCEPHPRGGFAVRLELDEGHLDELGLWLAEVRMRAVF